MMKRTSGRGLLNVFLAALICFVDTVINYKATFIFMSLLKKADKRAIDNLVSRTKFDQSIGSLDQTLQELLQRLAGQVRAADNFNFTLSSIHVLKSCIVC